MKPKLHAVPKEFEANARLNKEQYHTMYRESIDNPAKFWNEQGQRFVSWFKPWSSTLEGGFDQLNVRWFVQGKLNACYNCIDRHLEKKRNQIALIWEGNSPQDSQSFTYQQLYESVCRFANVLKQQGVSKGDKVCIYLPMIPEAVITMLACARIGAIHSVVFGGFSPLALRTRIQDAECTLIVTADEGIRGDKIIPLKKNVDEALQECPGVKKVIVVKHRHNSVSWVKQRDVDFHEAMQTVDADCPIEEMDSSDPLFILYTSGSTGKPKGILHTTGGYLVYASITHYYIFDQQPNDIHWCTADVGWITGHTYLVYGPLVNGATTLLYEGVPNYPNFSRFWEIIDKHKVTVFYTAPTAIRALRREGDDWVNKTHRESLRLLGTVGEPINPEVWEWYYQVVGKERCPIVDTWWQTETGGILISPIPGATPTPAGSAAWPFFGILPELLEDNGKPINNSGQGKLAIKKPWPGLMQTVYKNRQRFIETYFKEFPGYYLTGDTASRDSEGYYWIAGRNDDVIKVSGHRIGTEEVESALLTHPSVSEAAVVGIPDEIKGEVIYAFVTIKADLMTSDSLKMELIQKVSEEIGAIAKPQFIQWANMLPKTRSGKIMRRILRKIAINEVHDLGDTSTLADPEVVDKLIAERVNVGNQVRK
jgi:acetyl-CoA synthetase